MAIFTQKRRWTAASLGAMLLMAGIASAIEVKDLYVASVPSFSQSSLNQKDNFRKGLQQVLVRVTGDPALLNDPAIKELTQNADKWVQSFRQENNMLIVQFNEQAVLDLIKQAKQPIFGKNRPEVLVWLVMSNGAREQIIADEENAPLPLQFKQMAEQRGIPLVMPNQEMIETHGVDPTDLWLLNKDKVKNASSLYQHDAVLVGKIVTKGAYAFNSEWTLLWSNGVVERWQTNVASMDGLVHNAMDMLLAKLAKQLAVGTLSKQENFVKIRVKGVNTVEHFTKVRDTLLRQTTVSSLVQLTVLPNELEFYLKIIGSEDSFRRNLALNRSFISETASSYRWNP